MDPKIWNHLLILVVLVSIRILDHQKLDPGPLNGGLGGGSSPGARHRPLAHTLRTFCAICIHLHKLVRQGVWGAAAPQGGGPLGVRRVWHLFSVLLA